MPLRTLLPLETQVELIPKEMVEDLGDVFINPRSIAPVVMCVGFTVRDKTQRYLLELMNSCDWRGLQ